MVRVGSSSSAPGVNPTEQNENAFEQLISKIEPADFDLRPFLKQLKVLGRYELIKRNVYCTKRRVEDHGISCCCKPSPGSSVVCGRDCHCGMLFSCCSSQCECDNACTNKSFQHRPRKKTKFIKTEKCGHGLVAEDAIKKGEFVIEYVGEVIDDRTCEERLWTMKRLNDTDFYLCEVSSNMVIDATYKGNLSRFINHSCEPNTVMQKWTVDGETRVGIFALSDIKIGEELTYDYKKMLGTMKYSGCSQNHQAKKKKRETSFENSTQQFLRLWHPQQKI